MSRLNHGLTTEQTGEEKTELKQTQKDREKLDGYYECILCACCSHHAQAIGGMEINI